MFTAEELLPIKLTLELALITTVFLLLVATPLAWWRRTLNQNGGLRSAQLSHCRWFFRRASWAFTSWWPWDRQVLLEN